MDIRLNARDRARLDACWRRSPLDKRAVTITTDDTATVPVVIAHQPDGGFVEFIRGFRDVKAFIRCGYHRVRRNCPYRHRRCIAERCSLYHVDNATGDCAHIWALFPKRS